MSVDWVALAWSCAVSGSPTHVSTAINEHATTEELMEAVFSIRSLPRLYSEDPAAAQAVLSIKLHC
jgi:hypothetical protein